ncbi:hypothetical protein QJS10_CPB04g01527 [Acorus calamus]|uniref:Uncharacterized protein n=1 Tax=Acorus calamus TaxID=4465 RepID=A0AAV9F2L8_ACOCL|nr:hypothetical protein QJS10_CPB04g01527 [Acorus calamus]
MIEGYVIDAYFDLLKERIQDNPEVHRACLFGKHFAQNRRNGRVQTVAGGVTVGEMVSARKVLRWEENPRLAIFPNLILEANPHALAYYPHEGRGKLLA